MSRWILGAGAACGFLAVALGAFGAHGLRGAGLSARSLELWDTAVDYQMAHALAVLLAAALAGRGIAARAAARAAGLCLAGIAVFSGSLYLLALTGTRWLGAVTPLGGVCFLAGWVILTASALAPGTPARDA